MIIKWVNMEHHSEKYYRGSAMTELPVRFPPCINIQQGFMMDHWAMVRILECPSVWKAMRDEALFHDMAFNSASHTANKTILIGRLNSPGSSNDCLAGFTNYFSDRVQCVKSGGPVVQASGSLYGGATGFNSWTDSQIKSNQMYLYSPSYISWYLKVLYRNPA